jgi:predicted aldo/keto reductase-like oxidoreductase
MSELSRRTFLANLGGAGAALCAGAWMQHAPAAAAVKSGVDMATLGKSGLSTTVLGIGTGTHGGNEQRALGQPGLTTLVRHALDRGIRFIDTADSYRMHVLLQLALEGVPRDRYFIQTKTSAKHPEVAKVDIERFRRELKVDCLDILLMHCMTKKTWPVDMRPVQDVLLEAKRKGRIRAMGISCHGWDPLAASVEAEAIDVQLARINPFGAMMDGEPEKVAPLLKQMHDKGRGVLGMKIFGENGLGSREKRLASLKYVLGLGSVDAFTIGFTTTDQIDETLALIREAAG